MLDSPGRKPVLVVEDDAPTRQMIAVVLTRESFEVEVCADYREAASRVRASEYGAVVLALANRDPSLHNDVLVQLMGKPAPPCVVAISAGSQTALDNACSNLIRARLRKPFQIAELIAAVRSCFEDVS